MYHTLGLTEDIATGTLTDLDVISDEIIQTQNGHFLPPQAMNLYGAYALGTDLQRVKLTTPKIRQISPTFFRPFQPSLIGADNAAFIDYSMAPLGLLGQEEIVIEALQDAGANQRITVVLFAGENLIPIPDGDIYCIRGTSTTAATANKWSLIDVTFDSQLHAGRYAVICCECISSNAQAVRCIFDQQYYRPGAPGLTDVNQRLPDPWKRQRWGVWGYFVTYSQPRFEVLCNAADASHEIYLHVIRVAGG